MRVFLDTNVVVYAEDASAPAKMERARQLIVDGLRSQTGVVSTQVLQEFFSVVTRKLKLPVDDARHKALLLSKLDVVVLDAPLIVSAIDCHRLNGISFWDALVVTAALQAGCRRLYSEDLQDGRRFDDLKVVNPFTA